MLKAAYPEMAVADNCCTVRSILFAPRRLAEGKYRSGTTSRASSRTSRPSSMSGTLSAGASSLPCHFC